MGVDTLPPRHCRRGPRSAWLRGWTVTSCLFRHPVPRLRAWAAHPNPACNVAAYEASEMLQTDASYFVHSDDRAAYTSHLKSLLATLDPNASAAAAAAEPRRDSVNSSTNPATDSSGTSMLAMRSQRSNRKSVLSFPPGTGRR